MMKSIKNSVEIQRFTECIVRDSAAVAEFAAILEKEIEANRPWTEMDVMANLSKIRRGYEHNRGDSFETIAAYGSNAAIIHYTAKPETDRRIDTSSVFLLDSGGQYLDGTTDITRTFHYGTPTDKIKEAYTRILIGQIDLATTVWPEGLYGSDIDIRARSSLWTRGWNYNHGTGHGIGYFLSVHEGPGRIGTGYSSSYSPLYEGMFFSDEPGYYEDGDFGIRLEILVLIVKANITDSFEGRKYLAFKPLTLVPYETKLINYDMLSPSHKIWLNEYNQRCRDEVGKYLTARNKQQAYEWILARTELLPLTVPNDATRAGSAADRIIVLIGGGLAAAYVAIHVR
jgi:Xaa-Pro aminopeptidase